MMNVIKNAGAPAPPPSGNQPIIIQTEKKSNTTCIVIITVVCLCCVAPIVVFVAMLATAASAVSEIASNLPTNFTTETPTTTTTSTTTTPPFMNICQPGSPVEYFTGGEVWTADDFPEDMGPPPIDSLFMLYSPSYFDNNGDYAEPTGPAAAGTYDCVFTVTPADATEKIFLSAFGLQVNPANGESFSELTTDMTTCGNNYISINGVKKCGSQDMSDPANMANFMNIEFAAGESVDFELKTDNAEAMLGFQIYTGAELAMGGPSK